MNTYRFSFVRECPNDGEPIAYEAVIRSTRMLQVERLLAVPAEPAYQEDIADALFAEFGGQQSISATHQGVHITTERGP